MVELEINDKPISVPEGSTIIEAADAHGIYIPRFCYHKGLSVAANCRMCLVEVANVPKPLPACATPVTGGMKVYTQSKVALDSQRVVMEFLLVNHPLDCPICDQGGECELQDMAMGYGSASSDYTDCKRSVYSEDIGSLIETEMTRCIQCTRCVRFGEEVAGLRELGVLGRGENESIGTYVKHFVKSELSGNVIDLCPVGALTAKPSRYKSRSWELQEHPMVAPHDCVGSNIYLHTRGQQLFPQRSAMRVVPRENDDINESWISDRDRFSYEGLKSKDRIVKPQVKRNGQWQPVEWEPALLEIVDRLQAIIQQQGADQVAALASPNSTVEELYLLQKWMRALGSNNVDHRLHQNDFSDQNLTPEFPNLGMKIAEVAELDTVLLIGSNMRLEQPLLAHRINMAYQNHDAVVMSINPVDYRFSFAVQSKLIHKDIIESVAQVAQAIAQQKNISEKAFAHIEPSEQAQQIAQQLIDGEKAGIFLGAFALDHPQAAQLRQLVRWIGEHAGARFGCVTEGANGSGAWLAGAVPHREAAGKSTVGEGLNAKQLLTDKAVRAYFLLNTEVEYDAAFAAAAVEALKQAGIVVCISAFVSDAMLEYADFILPAAPFTETDGSYVNIEGSWQSYSASSVPGGDSKPAWKVLRVLANFMGYEGFEFQTAQQVCEELKIKVDAMPEYKAQPLQINDVKKASDALLRLASWPIYRSDNLVRRAACLQECLSLQELGIAVNAKTAKRLQLNFGDMVTAIQGDSQVSLALNIDDSLADDVVWLAQGTLASAGFGAGISAIELKRVEA